MGAAPISTTRFMSFIEKPLKILLEETPLETLKYIAQWLVTDSINNSRSQEHQDACSTLRKFIKYSCDNGLMFSSKQNLIVIPDPVPDENYGFLRFSKDKNAQGTKLMLHDFDPRLGAYVGHIYYQIHANAAISLKNWQSFGYNVGFSNPPEFLGVISGDRDCIIR